MANQVVINIDGEFTDAQAEAILAIGPVLREFLSSPNETATAKNNELQKLCGIARKTIINPEEKK